MFSIMKILINLNEKQTPNSKQDMYRKGIIKQKYNNLENPAYQRMSICLKTAYLAEIENFLLKVLQLKLKGS